MANFLSSLYPLYRRKIGSISVNFFGRTPAKATKLLIQCIGLRHLSISFEYRTWVFAYGRTQMVKLPGVKDLLQVRGLKTLKLELDDDLELHDRQLWNTFPELEAALQDLKLAHDPAFLVELEKKDDRIAKKHIRNPTRDKATRKDRALRKITL